MHTRACEVAELLRYLFSQYPMIDAHEVMVRYRQLMFDGHVYSHLGKEVEKNEVDPRFGMRRNVLVVNRFEYNRRAMKEAKRQGIIMHTPTITVPLRSGPDQDRDNPTRVE